MQTANGNGQTTAIVPARAAQSQSIEPQNMAELKDLARHAAASGFFGANSPEGALIIMMAGKDLGLSYTQALRAFHVIKGKPCLSADGMVAACLARRDVCEFFRTIESDNAKCIVEAKRVNDPPRRLAFTIEDAKRAGLGGDNWNKYPAAMLRARAKSALARDLFPDLLMGLYDPDEIAATPDAPRRADVVVTSVTQDAPAAPEPPTEDELQAAIDVVNACESVADLEGLADTLRGLQDRLGGPKTERSKALAKAYKERKAAILAAAQREPGAEG